jgi:hypothetical protein
MILFSFRDIRAIAQAGFAGQCVNECFVDCANFLSRRELTPEAPVMRKNLFMLREPQHERGGCGSAALRPSWCNSIWAREGINPVDGVFAGAVRRCVRKL